MNFIMKKFSFFLLFVLVISCESDKNEDQNHGASQTEAVSSNNTGQQNNVATALEYKADIKIVKEDLPNAVYNVGLNPVLVSKLVLHYEISDNYTSTVIETKNLCDHFQEKYRIYESEFIKKTESILIKGGQAWHTFRWRIPVLYLYAKIYTKEKPVFIELKRQCSFSLKSSLLSSIQNYEYDQSCDSMYIIAGKAFICTKGGGIYVWNLKTLEQHETGSWKEEGSFYQLIDKFLSTRGEPKLRHLKALRDYIDTKF